MAASVFLLGFLLLQGSVAIVVDVSPKESVVLPKQNVTFLCRVGVPVQYCRAEIPGLGIFNLNNKLPPRGGVYYYGAGISSGQCGFTIDNVNDNNNGKVKCFLGIETEYQEQVGIMQLTVARPPKAPELDLSRGTDSLRVYKIHDTLQASCVVRDGRPVANISWYLGDEPLVDGLSMPTIIDFAKEDLHSKVQNLTRTLRPSDNGKLLKCVAHHPALFDKNVASRQLDVRYAPQPLPSNQIDKFGYEINKPGIIDIEIDANPRPHLEWMLRDGQKIREGSVDNTGRIEAQVADDLGRGRYVARLRIAAINKQDTQSPFVLTAYNDIGSMDYTVHISTSPEPEGVEIGVGTIVAIIASVMLVLVIVFLLVFARIKGRWCFSASRESRTVGESSDTESADTRPKERKSILPPLKIPKPNVNMKMFRRKSDKVSHEEVDSKVMDPQEDKPAPEDPKNEETVDQKEGLVYAELDLVSQNLRPVVKNDDDKTEYAEIVYTPSDKPKETKVDDEKK